MKLDFFDYMTHEEITAVQKREAIIEGFVMQKSINILWAPAGTGKTEFMFGVSKLLIEKGQTVLYIDVDNAVELLKDRGYAEFITASNNKLLYNNAGKYDEPKIGIEKQLEAIRQATATQRFDNLVFVFDSLKFFLNGDMYDENKINRFVGFCKSIRRVGGCVFILNHAIKKGDTMKGGQGLVDAVDEVWHMNILPESESEYNYILEPEKQRMGKDNVYKVGFSMHKKTYELRTLDIEIAEMPQSEREAIEKVTAALKDKELTQGEIVVDLLGKTKGDRNTLAMLQKHEGRFWNIEKSGKEKKYKLAS
jgi:hypothetical protein